MTTIEMHRGDLHELTFNIVDDAGEPIEGITEIYFTVKKSQLERDFLLQKRLSTGGIVLDEGEYKLTILPADTDGLGFKSYPFQGIPRRRFCSW